MPPIAIADFTKGKRTRRGKPLSPEQMPEPFAVVAVPRSEIDRAIGARSEGERISFLREQKLLGRLVTDPSRLTNRVRLPDGRRVRMYVFRESVPPIRRRSRRIVYW